jgi:esterase/lipase superfamily enzyme
VSDAANYVEVSLGGVNGGSHHEEIQVTSPNIANAGYAQTKVYFATDRAVSRSTPPIKEFGSRRSGTISYGQCEISIPRDHRMGEIERPIWWKFEFSENPANHMVVLSTVTQSKASFFSDLKAKITNSAARNALIFFHGYNVTFDEAALRTAQMAYDIGFDGAPVFYSWPSNGDVLEYTVDENNIEWSQPHIKAFLADFVTQSGSDNIYLVAHSMGNRGMTKALATLFTEHPEYRKRFKEIILAAPDIDADIFKNDIAPALINAEQPITLYASSKDKALMASRKLHEYPRAGQSDPGSIIVLTGMETIDASNVETDFLGHSYVMDESSIISDIYYLVQGVRARNRFGLSASGKYFIFRK